LIGKHFLVISFPSEDERTAGLQHIISEVAPFCEQKAIEIFLFVYESLHTRYGNLKHRLKPFFETGLQSILSLHRFTNSSRTVYSCVAITT